MSTLNVTIEQLVIHPHDNADALELAQVGLYRAVVPKGRYKTGEYALYIPEQAIVPDELLDEIGLTGRLGGKAHNRVCTVRLRGEISQGIVCRPAAFNMFVPDYLWDRPVGGDFAEFLGITKWVPPIPVHLAGEVEPAPALMSWVDIENIQRYPAIFTPGEQVIATEKIHGTCCLLTYDAVDDRMYVSSKGLGAKKLGLKDSPDNLYWRTMRAHGVTTFARKVAESLDATRFAVYGEIFGAGVQDLHYGAAATSEKPGFRIFDIRVEEDGRDYWVSQEAVFYLAHAHGLETVPLLYTGEYDADFLVKLATGTEGITGQQTHLREGLVVRPVVERYSPVLGGRAIGKIVSPDYLTRKGGTEYE